MKESLNDLREKEGERGERGGGGGGRKEMGGKR